MEDSVFFEDESGFEILPCVDEEDFSEISLEDDDFCIENYEITPLDLSNKLCSKNEFESDNFCENSIQETKPIRRSFVNEIIDKPPLEEIVADNKENDSVQRNLSSMCTETKKILTSKISVDFSNGDRSSQEINHCKINPISKNIQHNNEKTYSDMDSKISASETICEKHLINLQNKICQNGPETTDKNQILNIANSLELKRTDERQIIRNVKSSNTQWNWFQNNKFFRCIMEKGRISINTICEAIEKGLDQLFGEGDLSHLTIITEESYPYALEKAFLDVFYDKIIISTMEISSESISGLPVGFEAGLRAAKTKLNHLIEKSLVPNDYLLLSTSRFVFESIPQRWQMCTALYFYDQKRKLDLFNFTVTTPLPQASSSEHSTDWAIDNVQLKEQNINMEMVNDDSGSNILASKASLEFFSEYNSYKAMKSAGFILAGMYKSHIDSEE